MICFPTFWNHYNIFSLRVALIEGELFKSEKMWKELHLLWECENYHLIKMWKELHPFKGVWKLPPHVGESYHSGRPVSVWSYHMNLKCTSLKEWSYLDENWGVWWILFYIEWYKVKVKRCSKSHSLNSRCA